MFTPRIQCCVCINIHELVPISPFYQVCDGNCTFRTVTVSKKRPGSVKPHFMVNLHGSADTGLKYNKEIMGGGIENHNATKLTLCLLNKMTTLSGSG